MLNIPNANEALPGLPSDIVVEAPTRVSGEKIAPKPLEHMPRRMYACVFYPRIEGLEWALEAFLARSKDLLIDVLMRDPRTISNKQAEEAIDAILNLPFNQDLKGGRREFSLNNERIRKAVMLGLTLNSEWLR